MNRRDFLRALFWAALLPLARPRLTLALGGRTGRIGTRLAYLTPSEYRYINRIAREMIPSDLVLSGDVDIALNIDRFLATTRADDITDMLHYLRLARMADPLKPVLRWFMPGIDQDLLSLKRVVCTLGYYSDANGEADLPPDERLIWPSIGFPGPQPEDYWPDDREPEIDPSKLEDRIGRVL